MKHTLHCQQAAYASPARLSRVTVIKTDSHRSYLLRLVLFFVAGLMMLAPRANAQKKTSLELRREHEAREKRERREEREQREREANGKERDGKGVSHTARGREMLKGELDFSRMAAWELQHPSVTRRKVENEEDENDLVIQKYTLDPALVKQKHSSPMMIAPAPDMPVSSTASDSFQAVLDNGTTIPPDTHGAVDSNYVVTATNTTVRIMTKTHTSISSVSLDNFWSPVLSGGGSFDPRVHYDPYSARWIIVAVSGGQSTSSSILIAVSKTSNPTSGWWMYKVGSTGTSGTDWLDYPNVGYNGKWLVVTGNYFSISAGTYSGANAWFFNYANLKSGGSASYTSINQGTSAFTLCPALTYSSSLQSMYLVDHYNYTVGAVRLWKVTGAIGSETMTQIAIPNSGMPWAPQGPSSGADFAPQLGTTNKIQNNDHRINQMIYINGKLWFSHNVFLPYSTSASPTHTGIQWWQIDTAGTPLQVGRVEDASGANFYAFPSIAVNANDDALIGFSAFSATTYPSAAYALRLHTDATDSIRTPFRYRTGKNTYYKNFGTTRDRWGDYSGTCVDPSNMTDFWTVQEASAATVNTWDTWWAKVTVAGCSVASITGTGTMCQGKTTTLADATSGGTWSTGSSIVSVGSSTGVVTGNSAGTATVTYTVGSCTVTTVVTVNANPAAITGSTTVCTGSTITLADATTGGTWGSANTSIATITTGGVVTGVSAGSTTITYYLSTGCYQTALIQVNSTPASITGTATVCTGATTSLSTTSTGGTWSSSSTGIATVNSTSGVVTGVAAGTATISYTLSSGCRTTKVVTVSATPAAIGGTTTVCAGNTTTLTNTSTGGSWFSANTAIATVGSANGVVTGVSAGSTMISYIMSGGCLQTALVMVNAAPSTISGGNAVCAGSSITLTDAPTGGTWSSSNTSIATIGSTTGIVSGVTAGSATISYVLTTGCRATMTMSVVSQPAVITGVTSACIGGTTTLSDGTTGGSWSSSDPSVATVSSTGVVSGVNAGTATITYALGSGCFRTTVVTISTSPAAITGTMTMCAGSSVTLSDSTGGGSWSSGAATVASVGSASGIVTGLAAGTATISYTLSGSCRATATVTVLAMPAAITGTATLCQGATTTLSSATTGGSWISGNTGVATISSGGMVTGVATGAATITYMLAGGCYQTTTVMVNPLPVVSGTSSVCVGSTVTLSSSITGGSWSSSSSNATVGATNGVVTGATAGTAIITFTTNSGCKGFNTVTVNPLPAAITGTATVCVGSVTTLADATTGGTWYSGASTTISVNSSGVVTGLAAGTSIVAYILPTGCTRTTTVTVNALPAAITGSTTMCPGSTVTLSSTTTGGTWSSASTAVATVSSTGVVTGVASGSTTITYKLTTGCYQTISVAVNSSPAAITGTASLCIGSTVTLADATPGGVWTSASSNVSVDGTSGAVTGITAGTATVTYSVGTGCATTKVVTVTAQPVIGGGSSVCVGGTTTLTGTPTGGTWSSMSTAIATVGTTTGVVTGMSVGSTAITYTLGTGCTQTAWIMVSPAPAAIGGTASVCVGGTTTLTNSVGGGSWSAGGSADIAIDPETGVITTGVTSGTATVTYAIGSCSVTKVVTVNPNPTITSGAMVCVGGTATAAATPTGGTWSSGTPSVATIVSTTGVVTGVSAGSSQITYKITSTGCYSTSYAVVNPLPSAITGTAAVCVGSSTILMDSTAGGSWSSSSTNISIDATSGIVVGISAGTATVSYTIGTGCRVTKVVTVNANPAAITGTTTACVGSTTTLASTTTGGTWSSANTSIASVNTTGVVTGVSAGSTAISYILTTGCYQVAYVMVNPVPPTISGPGAVCIGSTITLFDDVEGGTWSSSSSIVSVGSLDGTVTGVTAGTATVTYTQSTGCRTTKLITVNSLPAAITGTAATCVGSTTLLSDGTTGGSWSSSDNTIASFGTSGGTVTGVSAGAVTVSYTLTTGCSRTVVVTVNPSPSAITGANILCAGTSATLTDSTAGGLWSSSSTAVATIGSATGVISAVSSGVTNISYTIAGGCRAIMPVTINVQPTAITGTASVCQGLVTTLASTPTGGSWMSSDMTVATVGANGAVTGVSAGSATITYILATGCYRTVNVTVNSTASILGTPVVCVGATTSLSATISGGTWTSSSSYAPVGNTTGVVSGVTAGTAIITYILPTGCKSYQGVTVNAIPSAITGTASVCLDATTTLSSAPTGGTWSSGNPDGAFVTSSGVVYGLSVGTTTITYQLSTGCMRSVTVTVNALPTISGTAVVCAGSSTSLTGAPTGGTWTSGTTTVATVVSTTGVVTGVAAGSSMITYTASGTACKAAVPVVVNGLPGAIGGTLKACPGTTTVLSDTTAGGIWSVANTATATIDSAAGIVTGVAAGTTIVTYTLATDCFKTAVLTVNPLPAAITGTTSACVGSTTVLNNVATGVWSSSNTGVATVSTSHVVTGVSAGTATITFALSTGCITTTVVTINPLPAAITGASILCAGSTLTLSDSVAGGTWSTTATTIATVGATDGIVTGVNSGNASITYTLPTGCRTTVVVTVSAFQPITGVMNACVGMTTTLGSTTTGGTWSSSNTDVATVGSTGIVTGITSGTATMTYMLSTGCYRTTNVTINPVPTSITGGNVVCAGSTLSLSDDVPGGSWSTSNPSYATIGSATGIVAGVAGGTVTISYTVGSGCRTTTIITVNAQPAAVTGVLTVCEGAMTTLSETSTGGSWFSSDAGTATVSSTGMVTGVAAGTVSVGYMFTTGCSRTVVVTVSAAPGAIGGSLSVCAGNSTSLNDVTPGGSWSSSNTSIAAIGSTTGVATAVAAGTATITYTTGGCRATAVITVLATPGAITGTMTVCTGATTTLGSSTTGGTWYSGNPSAASIGVTTGVVAGVSSGTATVAYINANGCYTLATITVNTTPSLSGSLAICQGGTGIAFSTITGGTFTSGNTAVATVDGSGTISGVAAGTATITYMLPTGCYATVIATVSPNPAPITGTTSTYVGGSTTLSDATAGGTWSSSDPSIASVGSTGIVTGVNVGSVVVSYTLSTGCAASVLVNVSAVSGISGTLTVCAGSTTTLSNGVGGGTWQTTNPAIATVDVSGVVTGVAAGTVDILYVTSGGSTSATVTVNATPSSIGGTLVVCTGASTSLSSSPAGGTWSSSTTSVATIGSSTGVANGVAAGTTVISYMLSTGCFTTANLNVNASPAAITGSSSVPAGSTITLSSATAGGTWTSSDETIATVGSITGIVTGVSAGSVTISYALSTGCFITKLINVGAPVAPITGTAAVCEGATTTLGHPVSGGTWTSGNTSVATVSSTGVVTGVSAGVATISYAVPTGGMATVDVTVSATPALTGSLVLCASTTTSLSASISGGTWNSSVTSVATVDVNGVVSGVIAGTSTITYTLSSGCSARAVVTVVAGPSAITGTTSICVGGSSVLHNVTTGTWSSSDASIATVGLTNGLVTGIAAGSATITFTVSSGCYQTTLINVNAAPAAISGTLSACVGSVATLSSTTTGGTWSSSNTSVATIDLNTGIYTGIVAGVSNITYTVGAGCTTTTQITVNGVPSAISGTLTLCAGSTTTLSNGMGGGSWSSSDLSIATVSSSGVVSGVAGGQAIITYATGSGCYNTATVTVNALPVATGGASVCVGLTTTVTATPSGGTWSAVSSPAATITSVGVVTGVAAGTSIVTYTLASGCKTTTIVSVNSLPAAITGTMKVCPGATTVLSDAVTGGSWSSSDISTATVGLTDGTVTGVAAGTAVITYAAGAGCYRTITVTVNVGPSAIGGSLGVCVGFATTLTNTLAGGVWASGNTSVATISSSTGVATGVAAGTATISYTSGTGCMTTATLTVTSQPNILGTAKVCTGSTASLSAGTPGGTWSSSNSSVVSIDPSTGVMTGVTASYATITYSLGGTCYRTVAATVNTTPPAITGYTTVCIGTNTTLTSGSGGTWSSSNTAAGTVALNVGAVTGIAAGTTTITFMQTTGCFQTATVTVNPPVPAIAGTTVTCTGSTTSLTNSLPGGTWSSSNVATATVGSTGVVSGVGTGTVLISYNFGTGCRVTTVYTVNALPAVIGGSTSTVCAGSVITLTDVTSGGTWSSSNTSLATVGSVVNAGTGRVTGVSAGTVDITYTITSTGCFRSRNVTVNASSAGTISGPTTVIVANTITLSSTVAGGVWSSADGTVASVDPASGVVTGVGAGIVTISYTVTSPCGTFVATYPISVTTSRPGGNNFAEAIIISLYPNPTSGSFVVISPEAGTLMVYGLDGKVVAQYPVKAAMNELSLPHGIAAGVYMCRFNGNNGGYAMVQLVYEQ